MSHLSTTMDFLQSLFTNALVDGKINCMGCRLEDAVGSILEDANDPSISDPISMSIDVVRRVQFGLDLF